ncbi:MAG TPA: hypothetical protein VMF58_02155 [Rhizomicrobium sp.]|nr:hypothetical protein [Rhizomicrobium sp.]
MNKGILFSALLAGTALVSTVPAGAAPIDHPHRFLAHHPYAHARAHFVLRHDFRHFTPAEHRWWVGGRWRHTWWHGRYGWWWNVGPSWYFYDAPAYPYPGYVSDTYYDDENYDDDDQGGYGDQGGYDQGGPGDQGGYDQGGPGYGGPGGGYGGGVWYHCSSPEGYYPYVKNCRNWEQVPAQPSDMGPGPDGGPNDGPPPGYNGDDQGPPPPTNGR